VALDDRASSGVNSRPWVCVRHHEFEGPGLFATVAAERGIELRTIATDLGEPVPDAADVGGVLVVGGAYDVGDAATRPHLADESRLLAGAARAGLGVMGICLGAQLLAHGLGADVAAGQEERGMHDVTLTADGADDPVLGPEGPRMRAFQFHGEVAELPVGATRLATSPACAQQAFRFGDRAYGLQFHPELPDEFAAFIPEPFRPTDGERATLARLGRRLAERFFALAEVR
jgi:GMP synthase-like glutamine amidotransferase